MQSLVVRNLPSKDLGSIPSKGGEEKKFGGQKIVTMKFYESNKPCHMILLYGIFIKMNFFN